MTNDDSPVNRSRAFIALKDSADGRVTCRERIYVVSASDIMISFSLQSDGTEIDEMAQILVRNLEDSVKDALKRRAQRRGHSMEEEVREILRSSVDASADRAKPLGTAISDLFRDTGLEEPISELRGTRARPAKLED